VPHKKLGTRLARPGFCILGLQPSAEAWVRLGDLGWKWVYIGEGQGVAKIAMAAGIAKYRRNWKART